ncbi:MAG: hypothetical protein B7X08_04825 [Acidocella sp. 20-63-7]|nr:MAG: hypothetical protein B7X08_04825 [Acidocella sp. 20-63-7]HQT46430.1 hypothetical protein [Acidocella sp.]
MDTIQGYAKNNGEWELSLAHAIADLSTQAQGLKVELEATNKSLNYHRLCARAWEEVSLELARRPAGAVETSEGVQSLYQEKRRALLRCGRVMGRDLFGNPTEEQDVGPLNNDVIVAVMLDNRAVQAAMRTVP